MKKAFIYSLLACAALLIPSNAWATAYAVWCESNKTLYFTERSESLSAGGTFTPADGSASQKITYRWKDGSVTSTGTSAPGWHSSTTVYDNATTVVFEPSFSSVKPTSTYRWFDDFSKLTTIKGLQYLNTDYVTTMYQMFSGCSSLTSLDLSNFNTGKVTNMSYMFNGCSSLKTLDLSSFNVVRVTNMGYMFQNCSNLTDIDLSSFYTENVTDMDYMFKGCSCLTSIDLSEFDTGKAVRMIGMFSGCSGLKSLDVSGFNTENVLYMGEMFQGCSELSDLDVSGFNTGKVTDMHNMFDRCSKLKGLDVSKWNTAKVTNMAYLFCYCSLITSLDLSSFNTAKVTTMEEMFRNCSALTTIYAGSDWNTDKVTSSDYMFLNCKKLVGGYGATYKEGKGLDKTYAYVGVDGYLTGEETEVPSYALTVTAATLSTLYLDYPVEIPNDENLMGVYYGKGIGGETLRLARVTNVIPANTGVIVFANPGTYTFKRSAYAGMSITDNVLQGSTVRQNVSDIDGTVLTLGQGNTGSFIGFYQYTGTTLAANKAYIVLDSSSEVKSLTLSMEDEEATAISRPEVAEQGEQAIYNLSGQRVTAPRNGIYIVNGKKVFIK